MKKPINNGSKSEGIVDLTTLYFCRINLSRCNYDEIIGSFSLDLDDRSPSGKLEVEGFLVD
jgi:hypothetical protein